MRKNSREYIDEELPEEVIFYDDMEKKPKRKKHRFSALLLVLLLLLLAGIVARNALFRPPEIAEQQIKAADEPNTTATSSLASNSKRKDGVYTFMIIGMDKVAYNTDTIMVGRLDTKNGTVNVVSIPRDTYVNVRTKIKKINSIYPYAVTRGENGTKNLRRGIEKVVGFPIDSYAFVDIKAAARIVDVIGGVDFDVPVNMKYDDPEQDLHIDIQKGKQHLNGEDFVKVMRFRSSYVEGDLQRISVQQDLLTALSSQLLRAGNIKNIDDLLDIYDKYVETNLTKNNLYFYLQQFLLLDEGDISFETMPNTPATVDELSYVFINEEQWLKVINQKLNPYKKSVSASDLDIISAEDRGIPIESSAKLENELLDDAEKSDQAEADKDEETETQDEKTVSNNDDKRLIEE